MSSKQTIVFDFDEVLFGTRKMSLDFFREHYGVSLPDNEYFCGHSLETLIMEKIPQQSRPTRDDFYLHFSRQLLASHKWHEDVRPLRGAEKVIRELSRVYDLQVATARLQCSNVVVTNLLDRFFPGCFSGVHHVWRHNDDTGFYGVHKKDFVEGIPNRIAFIDDNPKEIKEMQGTTEVFLFDPFGYHVKEEGIPNRVASWEEIGFIFQE